jgi:hypothetical protein
MTEDPTSFRDEPTSREEMLDLAAADAIGALDAVEQARFERAFIASAPSLQADIRAVQDRIVQDHLAAGSVFRSSEQPPASLRLKTLARVASAIEAEGAAPIAVIGPARGASRASSDAREGTRDALLREILERTELERRPTQHLWRVAALFLFAALVVALLDFPLTPEPERLRVVLDTSATKQPGVRIKKKHLAEEWIDFPWHENRRATEERRSAAGPSC